MNVPQFESHYCPSFTRNADVAWRAASSAYNVCTSVRERMAQLIHPPTSIIECLSPSRLIYTSQYWGWTKYRYREVPKATFAAAKVAALELSIPALVYKPIMAFHVSLSDRFNG